MIIAIRGRSEAQNQAMGYWLGVLFFIFVLGSLVIGGMKLFMRLSSSQLMPMSEMLISGERRYVDDLDLQQILNALPQANNFFSMDVDKVQQALVAMPWLQQVSVRKQWPNKLRIYLDEQQLTARWNQRALLNGDGVIFEASQNKIERPLAELSGPDDQAPKALNYYRRLSEVLTVASLKITSLAVSERHSWDVTLGNGIILRLGRHDIVERAERFVKLIGQLDLTKLAYVDLRYDTGFAVGLNTQEGLNPK